MNQNPNQISNDPLRILAGFFNAKKRSLKKLFTKSVALALVISFSYTQLLWAIDVRQMLLDAKASFDLEDQTRASGTSSTDLEAAQTQQQTVIDQQNALQDLQNMNFSLTTQNGDILKYVGDTLNEITRPDGTTLNNIQLDANGNIIDADLKLSDGSIQVYQNGKVIGYLRPDGTSVDYNITTGRVDKTETKDHAVSTYLYTPDPNNSNNVIKTTVTSTKALSDGTQSVTVADYDAEGQLAQVVSPDGITTVFSQGKILKVLKDGYEYLYQSQTLDDGSIKLTLQEGTGGSGATETVLPIAILNTTAKSLRNGSSAWTQTGSASSASLL